MYKILLLLTLALAPNLFAWGGIDSYNSRIINLVSEKISLEQASEAIENLNMFDKENSDKRILLIISGFGGHGGVAIANFLPLINSPVDTLILSSCASGHTMLAASATGKRYAFSNIVIGIHIPVASDYGKGNKSEKKYQSFRNTYKNFWLQNSSLDMNLLNTVLDDGYVYLTPNEAKENGLIDEIIDLKK
ncbi:MAG: ATP-dependent Clp protease proteolytic subunit [Akkermansiaceae bacterium]